jgi:hypothetical protein
MTIFDYLKSILFTKKDVITNIDDETEYNQYMVNRWCSMYSPEIATIINNTTNWLAPALNTKQVHYNFLKSIIPKLRNKHIPYIKKVKVDKQDEKNIELLASSLELSKREIKYLLDIQNEYKKS